MHMYLIFATIYPTGVKKKECEENRFEQGLSEATCINDRNQSLVLRYFCHKLIFHVSSSSRDDDDDYDDDDDDDDRRSRKIISGLLIETP